MRPPPCSLHHATSATRPPPCSLCHATSAMRPPPCSLRHATSATRPLLCDPRYETSAMLLQIKPPITTSFTTNLLNIETHTTRVSGVLIPITDPICPCYSL